MSCDVIITACMVYCLFRSRTGIKSTDTLLTRLSRYAIETGLVTTVVAIADLSLYHRYPDLNIHLVPCYSLTKAYSNSLLAVSSSHDADTPWLDYLKQVLNSRAHFRRRRLDDDFPGDPTLTWAANAASEITGTSINGNTSSKTRVVEKQPSVESIQFAVAEWEFIFDEGTTDNWTRWNKAIHEDLQLHYSTSTIIYYSWSAGEGQQNASLLCSHETRRTTSTVYMKTIPVFR